MKIYDTGASTISPNTIEKHGYLVCGEAKPAAVAGKFEAWYWIDIPRSDPVRIAGPSRLETLTYATEGEAVAMAPQYDALIAGEQPLKGDAA